LYERFTVRDDLSIVMH